MEEIFSKRVFDHALQRLSVDFQIDLIENGLLRDIIEECFFFDFAGSTERKAELILAIIFGILVRGFNFEHFLQAVPASYKTEFLSTLLYQIFYLNFKVAFLSSQETFRFYLLKTLALYTLPDEKSEGFIDFCRRHYDEGSYRVLAKQEVVDPERVKRVAKYFSYPESVVERFCSIFGIYNHQAPVELEKYAALDDKLDHCQHPEFIQAIEDHLSALSKYQEQYTEGIKYITFALPTMGKDLSLYAWIPSITRSLERFCNELGIKNDIPIIIYDQSEPDLYAKNSAYTKRINPNCIHISSDDVMKMAKRLGVLGLIEQGGYGGARNALFLLAPLLKQCRDCDSIAKDHLRHIVLEERDGPSIIHMGDDDVHVPLSTVFSDALFASKHKNEYFCKYGWVKGRKTVWTESTFNLEYILEHPEEIVLQHSWQEEPFRHGMAGLLTKPKLSLNVPFGQEEAHMRAMQEYSFDFRQPMLHLSGYRFPKYMIPTNRFSGLADYLRAHYKYSIGAMLVSDLIDPLNRFNRCCLPWNVLERSFTSLTEAISYMCDPQVVARMQQGFEANIQTLSKGLQCYKDHQQEVSDLALFHLGVVELQDVDALVKKYSRFSAEMAELTKLFGELVRDYKSFKQLLSGQGIEATYFMTKSLQLLIGVVRSGSFQSSLPK